MANSPDSQPTTSSQRYAYGAINQFSVILINKFDASKAIDISKHVDYLILNESIFDNCLSGTIAIIDAIDLLNGLQSDTTNAQFPIIGEEVLQIQWNVIGSKTKNGYVGVFDVYSISEIVTENNNMKRTYNLNFCSREMTVDSYTLIQQGFNQPISNTAQTVFESYLSKEVNNNYNIFSSNPGFKAKSIVVEPTNGNQKIIVPRLTPFETMSFLRKRAISASGTNNSGTYLFFEDRNQFNFCDVETLIQNGLKKQESNIADSSTVSTYKYSVFHNYIGKPDTTGLPSSTLQVDEYFPHYKTASHLQQVSKFDTLSKLKLGAFESDVFVYDFINHKIVNPHFKAIEAPSIVTLGSKYENSKSFLKQINNKYTRRFFIAKDTSVPDNHLDQIIPRRTSYFSRMGESVFSLDVMGDLNIVVGDVIYLDFPTIAVAEGSTSKDQGPDQFLKGNFLIGSISHRVTPASYYSTYQLYKIGYEDQVPSPADKDTSFSLPSFNTQTNVAGYNNG